MCQCVEMSVEPSLLAQSDREALEGGNAASALGASSAETKAKHFLFFCNFSFGERIFELSPMLGTITLTGRSRHALVVCLLLC